MISLKELNAALNENGWFVVLPKYVVKGDCFFPGWLLEEETLNSFVSRVLYGPNPRVVEDIDLGWVVVRPIPERWLKARDHLRSIGCRVGLAGEMPAEGMRGWWLVTEEDLDQVCKFTGEHEGWEALLNQYATHAACDLFDLPIYWLPKGVEARVAPGVVPPPRLLPRKELNPSAVALVHGIERPMTLTLLFDLQTED
jgi:hypothetical protein